jgi:hypothetical protein
MNYKKIILAISLFAIFGLVFNLSVPAAHVQARTAAELQAEIQRLQERINLILRILQLQEMIVQLQRRLGLLPDRPPVVAPAPRIIVDSPASGQIITNPVRISGRSDTFEANVRIRVRDANNKILADTFTSGGTMGEFRPFGRDVVFAEPFSRTGFVEVFEDDAMDGREINMVSIPIVFGPYRERLANIEVLFPNGRERWETGRSYTVRWRAAGTDRITAFLILPREEARRQNCEESVVLITHMGAARGEAPATIATNVCPSDRYRIKVCDTNLLRPGGGGVFDLATCDVSDNYFSIISPVAAPTPTPLPPELTRETALTLLNIPIERCRAEGIPGKYRSCNVNIVRAIGEWYVAVTFDGLFDTSVRAHRREASILRADDGRFILGSQIVDTYKCQPGRGQQEFAARRCL